MMEKKYYRIIIYSFFLLTAFTDNLTLTDKSIIQIIIIMFAGGFLTAFTPCVYPLIPVTIGIISEINRHHSKSSFLMALIYASGIIITYTVLGIIAGLGSFTFGNYMGNLFFVWTIAVIFSSSAFQ